MDFQLQLLPVAWAPCRRLGEPHFVGCTRQAEYLKLRLMYCIAGLDRGFAASKAAAAEVSSAVNALVGFGEPVDFEGVLARCWRYP